MLRVNDFMCLLLSWKLLSQMISCVCHQVSSGAVPPLFNATLTYDRTQYCTSGEADGAEGGVSETVGSLSGSNREDSSSQEIKDSGKETDTVAAIPTHPTSSSFTSPLPSTTMCEVLQRIAGSRNTRCQVPNTCQTLECTTEDDNYRIGVTILPCGEIPSVMIAAYHLPEESTLLHKVYTGSSREPVYLGESRLLFNMVVSIKQSMARITLMVIAVSKMTRAPFNTNCLPHTRSGSPKL